MMASQATQRTAHEVEAMATDVASRVRSDFPPPDRWIKPEGYPNGLALCIVDSIQSIGVKYTSVEHVVARYRDHRRAEGGNPNLDGPGELLATFEEVGGVEGWSTSIGTENRAWSRSGAPLKARVIFQAATTLAEQNLVTPSDLIQRLADDESGPALEGAWRALPGQRSGISWRYLLMLAGVPGVKPDRMIARFVRASCTDAGRLDPDDLVAVVTRAAEILGVDPSLLDHAIWDFETGRTVATPVPAAQ